MQFLARWIFARIKWIVKGNLQFLTQIRKRNVVKEVIAMTRGRDVDGLSPKHCPSSYPMFTQDRGVMRMIILVSNDH